MKRILFAVLCLQAIENTKVSPKFPLVQIEVSLAPAERPSLSREATIVALRRLTRRSSPHLSAWGSSLLLTHSPPPLINRLWAQSNDSVCWGRQLRPPRAADSQLPTPNFTPPAAATYKTPKVRNTTQLH